MLLASSSFSWGFLPPFLFGISSFSLDHWSFSSVWCSGYFGTWGTSPLTVKSCFQSKPCFCHQNALDFHWSQLFVTWTSWNGRSWRLPCVHNMEASHFLHRKGKCFSKRLQVSEIFHELRDHCWTWNANSIQWSPCLWKVLLNDQNRDEVWTLFFGLLSFERFSEKTSVKGCRHRTILIYFPMAHSGTLSSFIVLLWCILNASW